MSSSVDFFKVTYLLLIYLFHQTYGLLPILLLKVVCVLPSQGMERGVLSPKDIGSKLWNTRLWRSQPAMTNNSLHLLLLLF